MNLILLTDSYKLSHAAQYPPGTENVYSYFESRGGAKYGETTFFGLQYLLKRYLAGVAVTPGDVDEATAMAEAHVGAGIFHRAGWQHILDAHGGRLPVRIRAVPEGMSVPVSNVLMTIEATDPLCYWLPNYLETLLVQVWYPCTVATVSRALRQMFDDWADRTATEGFDPSFMLHDFGFRGVSSVESAGIGGLAHLVNFQGTDTMAALQFGRRYYGSTMPGFSVPAAEHSTITSWGGAEHEVEAFRNMLRLYPRGPVSVVSDSYDIDRAIRQHWCQTLKDEVLARDGVLVVRPDSGHPPEQVSRALQALGDGFGFTTNRRGYKVLHPKVRVIQGDGCDHEMIQMILDRVCGQERWSVENLVFGMGGGLLQKLDRDTQRFAFKCSSVTVAGEKRDVFKQPASDPSKASKRGRLALIREAGELTTVQGPHPGDLLELVFENGELKSDWNFDTVRQRAQ